jgi:hypothetical protein
MGTAFPQTAILKCPKASSNHLRINPQIRPQIRRGVSPGLAMGDRTVSSAIVKLYEQLYEQPLSIQAKRAGEWIMADRILYVRLPCNPIFPIGVV